MPVSRIVNLAFLKECLDASKFCKICCEKNIGDVHELERLKCMKKCSSGNIGPSI